MKIRVGIQGDRGSANEDACKLFARRQEWQDYEIFYLISTHRVLSALSAGEIDFGTFAYKTARGGLVKETQDAIPHFTFTKIDEIEMQLHHAMFCNSEINKNDVVNIVSHPHALRDHSSFIEKIFPQYRLMTEDDTAIAAQKLKSGSYPANTIVIAPFSCAGIYHLKIYLDDLPTNNGYITTFYLVKQ